MANYLPTYCERRMFLSAPSPPPNKKTLSHTTFGRRKKNWAPRREKREKFSVRRREAFSAAVCLSAFPANLAAAGFLKRGVGAGVCADPEFVTQTSAAPTGWLAAEERSDHSQGSEAAEADGPRGRELIHTVLIICWFQFTADSNNRRKHIYIYVSKQKRKIPT